MADYRVEDFESTEVGEIPAGFIATQGPWAVNEDDPVSGTHAFGNTARNDGDQCVDASVVHADLGVTIRQIVKSLNSAGGGAPSLINPAVRCDTSFARGLLPLVTGVGSSSAGITSLTLILFKKVSGSFGLVDGSQRTLTFHDGDTINVGAELVTRVQIVANRVTLYFALNGAPFFEDASVFWDTDGSITGPGCPGFYQAGPSATGFDLYKVDDGTLVASLNAGTIENSGSSATTATFSGDTPSGGTAPLTIHWHISQTSGFTPGSSNQIAGEDDENIAITGLMADATYYVRRGVTDSAAPPATVYTSEVAFSTSSVAGATIAPTDAGIAYSPGNWGAVSGKMKTINAGATFETRFTGSSCTLSFDMAGVASPVPNLAVQVDGQAMQYAPLAATVAVAVPASTAASPKHHLRVVVRSTTETQSRWSPQSTAVVLAALSLHGPSDVVERPFPRLTRGLVFGTSITEGVRELNATAANDTDRNDSVPSWALRLGDRLGAAIGVIGFGNSGISTTGSGGVPPLPTSYAYLWEGMPRTFDSTLEFIVIESGTNDGNNDITVACVQLLNSLLSATSTTCRIAWMRPFNGDTQATRIQAACAGCADPSRVLYIDTDGWVGAGDTSDGLHPLASVSLAQIAPRLAAALVPLLGAAPVVTVAGRRFARIALGIFNQ